jgi:predicted nucleic acid-binding protein
MILVDSNIFMYAAGAKHPHRAASVAFIEKVAGGKVNAAINAEILQEILYRYRSLGRWDEGRLVYDGARTLFEHVLPVNGDVIDLARRMLDEYPWLGARDAVHAAAVEGYGLKGICSFDRVFDRIHGLRRVEP